MSKSVLSSSRIFLNATQREIDDSEISLIHSSNPAMKSKNHLLAELPSELRQYFLQVHYVGNKKSPMELASNLRFYARISCAHRDEVAELFRDDAYREVAFCSTAHAIPMFINKMSEIEIPKKIKAKTRLSQLAKGVPHLSANFCFAIQTSEDQEIIRKNRTPKKIMSQLLDEPGLGELRMDVSGPVRGKRHKAFRKENLNDYERRFALIGKHARFIKRLAKKFEGLAKEVDDPKKIELIYQNWPHGSLVNLLLNALADHPQSTFLKALDLSYGFCYEEIDLGFRSATKYDLANEFMEPLCEFLRANTSLNVLSLRDARMGKFSVAQLGAALEVNTSLRRLDISDNPIHYDGLAALAKALEINQVLEEMNLGGTDVKDEGADLLLAALKINTKIKLLLLTDNRISENHPIWKDARVRGHI